MKKFVLPFLYFIPSSLLFLISLFRFNYYREVLDTASQGMLSNIFLILLFFLCIYVILLFVTRGGVKYKLKYFLPSILLLAVAFPYLSQDIYGYLLPASNFIFFHQNPYLSVVANNLANPWRLLPGPVIWFNYPYPYGPVFLSIASMPLLFKIHTLWAAIYFYKITVVCFYIILIWIIKRWSDNKNKTITYLLWGLNPAVLVHILFDGHNDIFTITFLVLSLILLFKNKYSYSLILFIFSGMVKFYTFIFLPVFWFKKGHPNFKRILLSSASSFASLIIFIKLFNYDLKSLFSVFSGHCLYICSPIVNILKTLSPQNWATIQLISFVPIYGLTFFVFLYKKYEPFKFICWSFLALLFIGSSAVAPWYMLLIILFALLTKEKKYYYMVIFATAYSLLHFFII